MTTLRLLLIPLFVYFALYNYPYNNLIAAAVVFIVAGATDVMDGYIARKFNAISDFGKLYDPLVDKLFQITAVICLYIIGILDAWIIYFIVFKEGCMLIVGSILYLKKVVVHSHWYGKAATSVFYAAIFVMLITEDINETLTLVLLCTVVASAVLSAIGYIADLIVKK